MTHAATTSYTFFVSAVLLEQPGWREGIDMLSACRYLSRQP